MFGLLTLYWFKEKLVHRPQSLSNHSHRALLSTNQEQNQSQRLIGFRPWQALRGTDCTFSLWLIVFSTLLQLALWFLLRLNAESARVCMVNISFSRYANELNICRRRNLSNIFAHRKQLRCPEQTLCINRNPTIT